MSRDLYTHLTEEEFIGFVIEELSEDVEQEVDQHLESCEVCMQELENFYDAGENFPEAKWAGQRSAFVSQLRWKVFGSSHLPITVLPYKKINGEHLSASSHLRTAVMLHKKINIEQVFGTPDLRIAVLPHKKINIKNDGDLLISGVVEQVSHNLGENIERANVRLTVTPPRAVMNTRASLFNPLDVGRELEVDCVLRICDVRREGEYVLITAQLKSVHARQELWEEKFNVRYKSSFDIGDVISRKVAQRLNLKLIKAEQKRLFKRHAENPDADRKYVLGRFFLNKFPGISLDRAIDCFAGAIKLDDTFAEAHSGLADAKITKGIYHIAPPSKSFEEGLESARRALQINPTLAEAHTSLAYSYMCYKWDWMEAKGAYEKALEYNSSYALAYQGFGHLYAVLGKFSEAIAMNNRALTIDPISPMIFVVRAFIFYYAGDYLKAKQSSFRAISLYKYFDPAWYVLALTCVQMALARKRKGEVESADQYFREAEEAAKKADLYAYHNAQKLALLLLVYLLWGKEEEAEKTLNKLNEARKLKGSYISPYHMALLHVASNQPDDAIKCLEKSFEMRCQWMILMRHEPLFRILREDQRYKDLILRLDFPPDSKEVL